MHLRSVSLRDWKAYEAVRFDFPEPKNDGNVILIGGQNGFLERLPFLRLSPLGYTGRMGCRLYRARQPLPMNKAADYRSANSLSEL